MTFVVCRTMPNPLSHTCLGEGRDLNIYRGSSPPYLPAEQGTVNKVAFLELGGMSNLHRKASRDVTFIVKDKPSLKINISRTHCDVSTKEVLGHVLWGGQCPPHLSLPTPEILRLD